MSAPSPVSATSTVNFTMLQFGLGLFVLMVGAGIAWGTLSTQLAANADRLARIESEFKDFKQELYRMRGNQIVNEGLIDQSRIDIQALQLRTGETVVIVPPRSAKAGPK